MNIYIFQWLLYRSDGQGIYLAMTSIIDHISLRVRDYDTAKRFYDQTPQPFDARGKLTPTVSSSLCGIVSSRASRIGLHP
jgi:hypothetical protein